MGSDLDLKRENEELRARLAQLTEEAERNSEILARSQARELELLHAEDLPALFRRMLYGLRTSYNLDAVTALICDPDHELRHLLLAGGPDVSLPRGLEFVDALTGLAPQYVALHEPWLGSYAASDHQLIFRGYDGLRSIAMIPLRKQQRLFGSLNFGSREPSRFTIDHASDFFAHLGVIASFALENTVNRARLLRSGFTDVLTGWYNRRYLQVRLQEELARARRHATALTCLMLDLDHFKQVNDRHGHAAGDAVLHDLAQLIDGRIRATDVAARYGGEEFVILLPETDRTSGAQLAERIRSAVAAAHFDIGRQRTLSITVSIGVASVRPQRDDSDLKTAGDALIARADVALYQAKAEGRNRVAVDAR